ncbi:MAG TPA: YggT family protein [Blastocatellia bacterium]|nr:YggT family protein [Blastocatellia bacterium]
MTLIVLLLYGLSLVVFWGTIAVASLLFLRVLLTWIGANPFGRIPYHLTRITEPMVRPVRSQFGGGRYLRYDLIPLVMGVLILVTGLFIASMLGQFAAIISAIGRNIMSGAIASGAMMGELIRLTGLLYVVAIFLRFFMPFFGVGYRNKFFHFLFAITEPILKPLRRFFVAGMFDFTPIIAMFAVQILTGFLADLVSR